MNNLLESTNSTVSFEEENELIKRFLATLESEIAQSQISPSAFQETENLAEEFPQIIETIFQNLYVRENYINILMSIINHVSDRDINIIQDKQRTHDILNQELERTREILEVTRKKASDLENAYEREEKAKNELYGELGSLEDRSNEIKDLLTNAKVEIEDYKGILSYYREIEESLLKTKEALKHSHAENLRLKEENEVFEKRLTNLKTELDNLKLKHKENMEIHTVLSQENKRLKTAHRTLSQDFDSIIVENEKINEKNNELLLKLSYLEKGPAPTTFQEIEESEETEPENDNSEPKNDQTNKNVSKKTSIDRYLAQNKPNRHRFSKTENCIQQEIKEMTQEDLASKLQIKPTMAAPNTDNNDEQKKRHERTGSLFNEIIALKKIEIIDDLVFEEGFDKINRLNCEMKGWGPRVSELEISTNDQTLQKPLLGDGSMMDPDKNMRNLFKSKQIIQIPVEERKERRKSKDLKEEEGKQKDRNENPYEEFFILTGQCAKINCFFMNEVIDVDVKPFYKEVIEAKIPYNLWYRWMERKLLDVYDHKKRQKKPKRDSIYKRFKNCFFIK